MSDGGLRIIAGTWRRRRLQAPAGRAVTRPLPDRVKQSLFDALGQDCSGWRVADACAGSGSFGFECASRGAAEVHLLERAPEALRALAANHAALGAPATVRVHAGDAVASLGRLRDLDVVFLDPPFPAFAADPEFIARLLAAAGGAIAATGLVLLRGERGGALPPLPASLRQREWREYGRSWVAFLARAET